MRRPNFREAASRAVGGNVIGWGLGYLLCSLLGTIEFKSPFMDATRLPIYYSPYHYMIAGGIALAASAVAGYLPARKAASLHPVEIIRGAS